MAVPFVDIASVALDGSGNGTITFAPVRTRQNRRITRMVTEITNGSTANTGGTVKVYVGTAAPGNLVDGSQTPWLDISEGGIIILPSAAQLVVVYEDCGPAEVATFRVEGEQHDAVS